MTWPVGDETLADALKWWCANIVIGEGREPWTSEIAAKVLRLVRSGHPPGDLRDAITETVAANPERYGLVRYDGTGPHYGEAFRRRSREGADQGRGDERG